MEVRESRIKWRAVKKTVCIVVDIRDKSKLEGQSGNVKIKQAQIFIYVVSV